MHIILVVSVLIISSTTVAARTIAKVSERAVFPFDIKKFLQSYGYPFEPHAVTTEDGYILGVHRIPYGSDATINPFEIRPAVLIMPGLLSSSVDFFILGPERSLPLMLADLGYDVWLGNNRGNTWSRQHISLSPDNDEQFWDFSFHELGVYDDPAIIDYILRATKNTNLTYIGHSQGTTQFFAMASARPEYNQKINLMSALAPVAYMEHMANPLVQEIKDFYDLIVSLAADLNIHEILPLSSVQELFPMEELCSDSSDTQELCASLLFILGGFDSEQLNRTILTTFLENLPAGASFKELIHYLQEVISGHFRQYDYGSDENIVRYGSAEPPDYDVSQITAPVALYYSQNDFFAAMIDVERLADELPNVVDKNLNKFIRFSHLDPIIATDVVSLLYNDVIDLINKVHGK